MCRVKFSRKSRLCRCKRLSGCSKSLVGLRHVQSMLLCPIEIKIKSGKRFIASKSPICPEKLRVRRILSLTFVIDKRTDAPAFNRDKWREFLQSLRDALNSQWRRVGIEKPVIPAAGARAPKRAPGRRDINSRADAVTDHGDMRQPRDQLGLQNLATSIRQVIRMQARCWLSDPLQKIRADNPDRLPHRF